LTPSTVTLQTALWATARPLKRPVASTDFILNEMRVKWQRTYVQTRDIGKADGNYENQLGVLYTNIDKKSFQLHGGQMLHTHSLPIKPIAIFTPGMTILGTGRRGRDTVGALHSGQHRVDWRQYISSLELGEPTRAVQRQGSSIPGPI
jgi:hypothetical protein